MTDAKLVHTDQRFVTALLQNDTALVKEIYERFAGNVKRFVLNNNGSEDEAADIFQEGLIVKLADELRYGVSPLYQFFAASGIFIKSFPAFNTEKASSNHIV